MDGIGFGEVLANLLVIMGFSLLLILNVILFIIKEKKAKLSLLSIILNIISVVFFGGYAYNLIFLFNLIAWPLFNLIFMLMVLIKHVSISFKNRKKKKLNSKKIKIRNILLGVVLSIFVIWFSIVAWFFFKIFFDFSF
jgi:hypothetical protein